MSLRVKMLGNGVASGGSIAWSALIQLMSVPLLTGVWGLDRYGQWLMLSTIPTYFALSDLGFATAATSDMTMSYALGRKNDVITTFQSVWALLLIISMVVLVLLSPLLFLGLLSPNEFEWWPHQAVAIYWMIAYSAAALCSRVVLAGFRSTGFYASGTMLYDAIQFLEGLAVILVARAGGSFADCAFFYLFVRLSNVVICYLYLRKKVPWLQLGFFEARSSELRRLLGPAIAAMAIPTALAINIQGLILVAGFIITPAAAAVLGAVRTVSRIAIQLVGIISRASMPEFASAMARNDIVSLRKILKINLGSVFLILIPGSIIFSFFGGRFILFWSHGRVIAEESFIYVMAIGMFFQGVWSSASNLLLSINEHGKFAKILMIVAVISVVIAVPLGAKFGLMGLAIAILISDFIAVFGVAYRGGTRLRRILN